MQDMEALMGTAQVIMEDMEEVQAVKMAAEAEADIMAEEAATGIIVTAEAEAVPILMVPQLQVLF
jgi:hypothetical protein